MSEWSAEIAVNLLSLGLVEQEKDEAEDEESQS
jgi:hypothetical protein